MAEKGAEEEGKTSKPELGRYENPVFRDMLMRIAGERGCEVVSALLKEELTDEELSKRTKIQLNLVRRILYDLYENRVVNYRRVRDEETGWYTYYWRAEPERAMEYFNANKRLLLQKLRERLEYERNNIFFACEDGCQRLAFDAAMESNFRCPSCNKMMEQFDNSDIIAAIERQVELLRRYLGED